MLSGNLKNARKAKGLSQQELAIKINVVRQTVSKWEKGLSVPDSQMLIDISEALETNVSELLGEKIEEKESESIEALAAKLEVLNEQFAKQNEKRRKIWHIVFFVVLAFVLISFFIELLLIIFLSTINRISSGDVSIIGGADGPTKIFVSKITSNGYFDLIPIAAVGILAGVGIYKTRRT